MLNLKPGVETPGYFRKSLRDCKSPARRGYLNRYEAEFAFSNVGVAQMLQTGFAYQRPDDAARAFADLDVDGDGRVSFDEFAAYYTPTAKQLQNVGGAQEDSDCLLAPQWQKLFEDKVAQMLKKL